MEQLSYLNFKIYDVFGSVALSSYTLPSTPLTFIPQFDTYNSNVFSNHYILWDFGDGTYSKEISAVHHYKLPGNYLITLKLIRVDGSGTTDLVNRSIVIEDYVADFISLSTTGFAELTAGVYSPPIDIYRYNSWQSYDQLKGEYSIIPFASGGLSPAYDVYNYSRQPYSQLIPTNRFVVREKVGVLDIYDDIIVDRIITTSDKIYVTLDYENKSYIASTTQTASSVFAGTSGVKTVYFVDDVPKVPSTGYNLFFSFDTTNFDTTTTIHQQLPVLNVNSAVYSFDYVASSIPLTISITSNGIAGEGQDLDTFNINGAQLKEGVLSFVVRLRGDHSSSVSYIPLSGAGNVYNQFFLNNYPNCVYLMLINKNSEIIPGYITPLSSIQISSPVYTDIIAPYVKGKITLSNVPATSCENVRIFAIGSFTNINTPYSDQTAYFSNKIITGVSAPFTIYSSENYGKVAKVNENLDSYKLYNSLATQPVIAESETLVRKVLGQIGGDLYANINTLGKRIYEKTANYTDNLADIDVCNTEGILAQCELYGIDTKKYVRENLLTKYPAELVRLVDLFSIKRNYLFGTKNTWNENLNKRTNPYNTTYGINTNLQNTTYSSPISTLPIATTILDKNDKYIVAYENFTSLYSIVPLYIASVATTFPLSSIDQSWGWNLVLPDNFYSLPQSEKVIVLNKFYTFYKWNDYVDGTILGSVINWNDTINTQIKLPDYQQYPAWNSPNLLSSWYDSSLSAWYEKNGYVDRNLIFTLSDGVGILTGAN